MGAASAYLSGGDVLQSAITAAFAQHWNGNHTRNRLLRGESHEPITIEQSAALGQIFLAGTLTPCSVVCAALSLAFTAYSATNYFIQGDVARGGITALGGIGGVGAGQVYKTIAFDSLDNLGARMTSASTEYFINERGSNQIRRREANGR